MFHRLTPRARQVVVLAREEARAAGHSQIGPGHIVLGLLREQEGVAARALAALEISAERVRTHVMRAPPAGEAITSDDIPLATDARRALELATREALALGHNYVGTEHILLGLVREPGSAAARILLDVGSEPEKVRSEVVRVLSAPDTPRRRQSQPGPTPPEVEPAELPEVGTLSGDELRDMIRERAAREQEVSRERRILHAELDVLRHELVTRLRRRYERGC